MTTAILLAILFAPSAHVGAAVSHEMVCSIQRSVIRQPTWSESEYQRVAAALKETPRPGVFDVGLLAVRCVTSADERNRAETWTLSAGALIAKRETAEPAGRCQNGSARGID